MKKLGIILVLLVLGWVIFAQSRVEASSPVRRFLYYSSCSSPIKYKIGTIDPKFNISQKDFQTDAQQAAQIWKKAYGKDLLIYDPEGSLTINLVYDGRQSLVSQINNLNDQLDKGKSELDPEISDYQDKSKAFEAKISQYENQVSYWNSRGGAPEEEYNKLKQMEVDLKSEADNLNAQAKKLHQQTVSFNTEVDKLNNTVNTFNSTLQVKPEEGIFDPQTYTITIYFDVNQTELVHTLAHEMGHALGMDHVDVKSSIMNPTTNSSLVPVKEEIEELQDICKERSVWSIAGTKLKTVAQFYIQRYRQATQ